MIQFFESEFGGYVPAIHPHLRPIQTHEFRKTRPGTWNRGWRKAERRRFMTALEEIYNKGGVHNPLFVSEYALRRISNFTEGL